jgi:hypothetical protein
VSQQLLNFDAEELLAQPVREWLAYHRANPRVYELLLRFAREVKAAGFHRYGIRPITERVRWHVAIETRNAGGFKINDHHQPYYARLIMAAHPSEFGGFFETRNHARFPVSSEMILELSGVGGER